MLVPCYYLHWSLIFWVITVKDFRLWVFLVLRYKRHMLMGQSDPDRRFHGVNSCCGATLLFSISHFTLQKVDGEGFTYASVRIVTLHRRRLFTGSVSRDWWVDVGEVRKADPEGQGLESAFNSSHWVCYLPLHSQLRVWLMLFNIYILFPLVFILTATGTSGSICWGAFIAHWK